jgi:hypothetical protein
MTKLTFKRIALVVVTALGLGLMSTGPSNSAILASSDTLTISATSSSIAAGETASVTVTQTAIGQAAGDSLAVYVQDQSQPSAATSSSRGTIGFYVTDSSNARIRTTAQAGAYHLEATKHVLDYNGNAGTDSTTDIYSAMGGSSAMSQTLSLRFMAPTTVGTYVFRIYAVNHSNNGSAVSYSPVATPLTWTVTVTANASSVGTTASKFWMNRATEYLGWQQGAGLGLDSGANAFKVIEADSSLVVSAGTAGTNTPHAVISPVVMNSSDTKISTVTGLRVQESMTITISGPGSLRVHGRAASATSGLEGFSANGGAYSKQVSIRWDETAVVYSDGSAGVGTISAYIGGSATSTNLLTQGTKSITFVGRATTFTVTGFTPGQRAGGNAPYRTAADSATSVATGNLAEGLLPAIRFVATDVAGNAVTVNTLSTDKGDSTRGFYAISSDTAIVARGPVSATNTFATNGDRRNAALPCSYDVVTAYWYCEGRVFDSGTVTLTIVDSRTITANGNSTTSTTDAVYKSAAFSVTFAGNGNTGTIALNKAAYSVNEAATLTLTCKDGEGRTVADARYTGCFSNLSWKSTGAPTFGEDTSAKAAGGSFTNLVTYLTSGGPSFFGGTDTALVFMPTVGGTYTLQGSTGASTAVVDLLTFTVTDPVAVAQAAAIAASQAAADAATDAALEAIDAANAATDAANLAAEAADAATVAAEEARDAADAATAAVEALATEVATLMSALKAQITTLARTVAKIAKKVNA